MSSPLLINESPLQVLPSLAVAVGLNEAIILQQVHYWISNKDKRQKPYERDGKRWVYNTYEEWREQFPFWSVRTIQRHTLELEKQGVLIVEQFDLKAGDARKYYTIDYDKLNVLVAPPSRQVGTTPHDKLALPPHDKLALPSRQLGTTLVPSWHYLNKETETTTETNTEREPRVSSSSVKATANVARFVIPTNAFDPAKEESWSVGERFILKACDLWEKPILELDPKVKISVKANGKWVNDRIDVKAQIGGTPSLFREFWFGELKRKVNPRPEYVVEQWDAYDRWLIENHETHRQGRAA